MSGGSALAGGCRAGLKLHEPHLNARVVARKLGKRCGEGARAIRREGGDAQAPNLEVRVAVQCPFRAVEARDDLIVEGIKPG